MSKTLLLVLACSMGLSTAALAQPRITITTIGDDLSANGNCATGSLYDGNSQSYKFFTWKRGVGFTQIPGSMPGGGGVLTCSADGTVFGCAQDNASNWEGLNCFAGYTATGEAKPPLENCVMRSIAHRYTTATGWVNAGSLARTLDPATGRWVGGTCCDATINTVSDTSGNGRYIIGGAYSAVAINSVGNPSLGLCGDFFAYRYDGQTGEFLKLATSSHTTRADRVNSDGSVITGYDIGPIADGAGGFYPERRLTVWYNNVETVLDTGGNQDSAPVNGPGTMVAAGASRAFCLAQFGTNSMRLVKWTRTGSTWTPQNLGRPVDIEDEWGTIMPFNAISAYGISDDGNTIVGTAYYGGVPGQRAGTQRPFIWRPTINGGVPMDLGAYLATQDPSGVTMVPGMSITAAYALSADGNSMLISGFDDRSDCVAPASTLTTFFRGILTLNPAGQANEPPSIAIGPVDESTRCTWAGWGTVFNVMAGGSWPLNYQWQREDPANPGQWISLANSCSGQPGSDFPHDSSWEYEGVNKPQLRVNVITGDSSHDGRYRVIVSNAYGSVTSNPATFTFAAPINPVMPQPATGCPLAPAVFTVGSIPGGVSYSWYVCTDRNADTWAYVHDGSNTIAALGGTFYATGTRTGTVSINPGTLSATQTYDFRCRIADSCNSLDTDAATMTVAAPCGMADVGAQGGVPAPCGDRILDNNDFIVFIDYFFNSDVIADMGSQGGVPGADGQWDNNDFIVFIDYFFNGCN